MVKPISLPIPMDAPNGAEPMMNPFESTPPGRLWIIGQTRSQAIQGVLNLSLRALMLLTPLLCQ